MHDLPVLMLSLNVLPSGGLPCLAKQHAATAFTELLQLVPSPPPPTAACQALFWHITVPTLCICHFCPGNVFPVTCRLANLWIQRLLLHHWRHRLTAFISAAWQHSRHLGRRNAALQMVNVQSNSQFGSHQLNRDTWSDPTLTSIIMGSFVFWQVSLC